MHITSGTDKNMGNQFKNTFDLPAKKAISRIQDYRVPMDVTMISG
jgi:hypothetical protein